LAIPPRSDRRLLRSFSDPTRAAGPEGGRSATTGTQDQEGAVMAVRAIHITKPDMEKLRALIEGVRGSSGKPTANLDSLEKELDRAKQVSPQKVPKEVVTMNSRVRLRDLDSGEESVYTIVFPDQTNLEQGKISVLAPIGTALLGYRVGAQVEWQVPSGTRRLEILEVLYQPEAAGRFDL
jgi:regulator of nucleoside diphosphate kinase